MKKTILFFSLIILIIFYSCKQFQFNKDNVRNNILEIVQKIEKKNYLQMSEHGYYGTKPEQYVLFDSLKKSATNEELTELTNYNNGVVRVYSFWALALRKNFDILPILLDHINDTTLIDTWHFDIIYSERVGDLMIDMLTRNRIDPDLPELSENQRLILDSVLFNTDNYLEATSIAINKAKQSDENYKRLKHLIKQHQNPDALVALSKYKKKDDIELIKNFINEDIDNNKEYRYRAPEYYVFSSIANFPDPEFWDLLLENQYNQKLKRANGYELYAYLKAVAMYKNEDALKIIMKPLNIRDSSERSRHICYVFQALKEVRDTIYDNLLFYLWEKENKITIPILTFFLKQDSEKTIKQIWKSMENLDKKNNIYTNSSFLISPDGNIDDREDLIMQIMNITYKIDKKRTIDIINKNILASDWTMFYLFEKKIIEYKHESSIEPLFERLEKEKNQYINVKIFKTLLEYKQEKINNRLLQVRRENWKFKHDWWGEDIKKLFEEYNLPID